MLIRLIPNEMVRKIKGTELANLCVDTISETEYHARRGVRRIRKEKDLAFAFLRHTGLPF